VQLKKLSVNVIFDLSEGALKMEDRKMEDHFAGMENAGPENAGLDFEAPSRRSNGVVCSKVV